MTSRRPAPPRKRPSRHPSSGNGPGYGRSDRRAIPSLWRLLPWVLVGILMGAIALLLALLFIFPERAITALNVLRGVTPTPVAMGSIPTATTNSESGVVITPTGTPIPPATPAALSPTSTSTNMPVPTDTPMPLPSATPLPTITNTPVLPSATPIPLPISVSELSVLYQEDFSNPETGWTRTACWGSSTGMDDGEMVVNTECSSIIVQPSLVFDNFILEVEGRWSGGAVGGTYGVLFRYQRDERGRPQDYYVILIGNDGRYQLGKRVDYDWITLEEDFSDAINRDGSANRFHIEANGPDLSFFVNGQRSCLA